MAQIGYNPGAWSGYFSRGDGTNQCWDSGAFNTSVPIILTTMHAYFSTYTGGTATCALCAWDSGGNLLGSVNVSVPQLSSGQGAQQWNAANCSIFVPAGNFYMGFWVPGGNGFNTSCSSSYALYVKATGGGIGNLASGTNTGYGGIGVYADYVPAGVKVRRSGAWVNAGVKIRRSGAWQYATVKVRRSGAWVNSQ